MQSILNYAEEKPGALDEKSRKELKTVQERLTGLMAQWQSSKEGVIGSRDETGKALVKLTQTVMRARHALEMASIGGSGSSLVPRATKGMYLASRIHGVALSHVEALDLAGTDQTFTKARAAITTDLAAFDKAYSATKSQRLALGDLGCSLEEELSAIAQKLSAYKSFVAASVPRRDRRDLRNRLRAVARPAGHRKAGETATAPAPEVKTTVQPPALPAVPALPTGTTELRRDGVTSPTPVPPSSEHPSISANA